MACLTVQAANKFLAEDSNRIAGGVIRSLAINSPWLNVIDTGTFPAGVSDIQRSIVQGAIAPVLSQATPNWDTFSCTRTPTVVQSGSTQYQYTPLTHFERGPSLCVTQSFSSISNALSQFENALSDHVTTLWNSWIRYQMYLNASNKVTVRAGLSLSDMLATGFGTNFKVTNGSPVVPNAPINFNFLKALANYLTHQRLAGPNAQWGSGVGMHFRFISDQDTVDAVRAQSDVRLDLRSITNGGNAMGKEALLAYSWDGPYQGIGFGVDQSIMRASGINANGTINFIEPFYAVTDSTGVSRAVNPAWLSAPYQVSFLLGKGSLKRLIPEEYTGAGMTKFDKQFWGGKIIWHNQQDNTCNVKGDTGFHYWDLASAIRPERPEFIIPILHTRCNADYNLLACTPQGYYANSL